MTLTSTPEAIGASDVFLHMQDRLSTAAGVDRPVLLAGERGTGKELAAARLHFLSPRWQGPFAPLNCAALPENLVESELFGHEAGAFTGAAARRAGRFEACAGGTLFLDEIGQMPATVQEKILRAIEYKRFERVGGSAVVEADVRVVAASNIDLPALAKAGKFRADLLDRLSFEVITLPPLRARGDDVFLLAEHFASRMAAELGCALAPRFAAQAQDQMVTHHWPGNIRELKNAVERAVYRAVAQSGPEPDHRPVVRELDLDPFASPYRPAGPDTAVADEPPGTAQAPPPATPAALPAPSASPDTPLPDQVRELEIALVTRALEQARHNQRRAAEILGLTYHQLRGLLRKHKDRIDTG